MTGHAEVVVIGAGLAGLACARALHRAGTACTVVEASDGVGGRVRTDVVDGFTLDRGFQVLLTAYPEARAVLDYPALDLRPFEPGAVIRLADGWARVSDPLRRPLRAPATALAPVGTLADKLRVARLALRLRRGTVDDVFRRPERTTRQALADEGFGDTMVEAFFRPFLGGVQLDRSLSTSSRLFEFTLRMFAAGATAVPAQGMQAIPEQIAAGLPPGTVRLGVPVTKVTAGRVHLGTGESEEAEAVVVATDGPAAARLLDDRLTASVARGTTCLTFAVDRAPLPDRAIVLDGTGEGPVNNLHVATNVAPEYAPPGQALVSATVVGEADPDDAALEVSARRQLTGWFGADVERWRHLRTDRIPFAVPDQPPGALEPPERPVRLAPGLFVCGDHRDNASINGALVSGRRAAEAVLADLRA